MRCRAIFGGVVLLVIVSLSLAPVIYFPFPAGTYNCPPDGCQFVRFGSVTYWAFGVGGVLTMNNRYVIDLPAASQSQTASSSVSYYVTATPIYTATAVTNSADNLRLELIVNPTSSSATGVSVSVTVDEYNTLDAANNVTATSSWSVPVNGLSDVPCWPSNLPLGLGIAKGNYSVSNVTSPKFLDLVNPTATYACSMILSSIRSYLFQPMNDTAAIYGSCSPGPCMTEKMASKVTVNGYWSQDGTFTALPRGLYTVAAGDEWGYSAVAYFTVSWNG